jgi:hypothetical protein
MPRTLGTTLTASLSALPQTLGCSGVDKLELCLVKVDSQL